MYCENCNKEHDGSYGSGRFCSTKCSRGFSTKAKRSLINEKVRKKLSHNKLKKVCICGESFETKKKKQIYCSRKCSSYYNNIGKPKKKGKDRKKGSGGLREGGGRAKVYPYTNWLGENMKLNNEEINFAKILDSKKINWKRNWNGFSYVDLEGKDRKFYPDFVINDSTYVEYKGWVTKEMHHKMKDAETKNDLDLIIVVGNSRYANFGINIKEFENELVNF